MFVKSHRRSGRSRQEFRRSYWPKAIVDWQELSTKINPMSSWDLSSIHRIQTLNLHRNDVNGVAFSTNLQVATASSDKTAQICEWESGQGFTPRFTLKEHKYSVTCVEWSPFGTLLATGSTDGTVILWDASTGEKVTSYVQPGNTAVRTCSFSSQSNYFLSAGDSGNVNIWDINHLATEKLAISFLHGEEAVYGASFCPAELSDYLVSGCSGGLLCLWDASAGSSSHGKPLASYENAHDSGVTCVAFAPTLVSSDGGLLKQCLMVTGGQDHLVRLWNITLGLDFDIEALRILDEHSASVFCVRISSVGLIASASSDKTVRIWNIAGKCVKVLEGHDRYVTSCAFSKDGRILASGSNDKTVIVWDLTGTIQLSEDMKNFHDFTLSKQDLWPQYEKLCKSKMQFEKSVNLKASFEVPKIDFNSCLIIGSSNIILASSSSSKYLFGWNLNTQKSIDLSSICLHKDSVTGLHYSPQLETVASISGDGSINLYTIGPMNKMVKCAGFYHPSGGALRVCRFSPDGCLLLVGSEDEQASLWNAKTNSLIKQFKEHHAVIFAASFSPGGQYVVTGCSNGWLKLWDCQNDENFSSISTQKTAHELGVLSCDFSPNGLGGSRGQHRLLLASGGNDSLVKLWQVTIGHETSEFMLWQTFADHGTHVNVNCVTFSPSGKLLASCAENIRLWDVSNGTCVQVIGGHERYVTGICFSSDGTHLVSCSGDHTVKVWELKNDLACKTRATENLAIEAMISKWTTENVINWLAEIGLGDLGHKFESKKITGNELVHLNNSSLANEIGIEEEATRKQLLTELQWLKSIGVSSKRTVKRTNTIAVPQEFFCPITHDIFAEPVICADGNTYELAAIKAWFLMGRTTSPLTNVELESMTLTPNFELQNRISEFLAQRLNPS